MLFGRVTRVECAEVPSLPGLGIFLAGVQSILPRLQFSNHVLVLSQGFRRILFRKGRAGILFS